MSDFNSILKLGRVSKPKIGFGSDRTNIKDPDFFRHTIPTNTPGSATLREKILAYKGVF